MKITALILENVRCFRERQRLQIRPLTFLVGEDGAGKTTALQCFKAAHGVLREPAFQHAGIITYMLGNYADIVSHTDDAPDTFHIGYGYDADGVSKQVMVDFHAEDREKAWHYDYEVNGERQALAIAALPSIPPVVLLNPSASTMEGLANALKMHTDTASDDGSVFLLQHPAVYLHPKEQAAFTSHLVTLAREHGHTFIVETHSDYLLDRARIEIHRGNIAPEDLAFVYFEKYENRVGCYNITFDDMANMSGMPDDYRLWFHEEMNQLMGSVKNEFTVSSGAAATGKSVHCEGC